MARRKRKGRGRLSTIDMLPEIAAPDIQWAVDELVAGKRTQGEILVDFNQRLEALGIGPVSPSAFNRHSMRIANLTRDMKESEEVTRAIVDRMGADTGDELTKALSVLLKQAILKARERGVDDPDSILSMSRSLQAIASAQKTSADVRRQAEVEIATKLKKAAEAVKAVGKERGIGQETIDIISDRIMGVTN